MLKLLLSPLGEGLAIAALALGVLSGAYQAGRNTAARECDRAALQSQVKALAKDLVVEQRARAAADAKAMTIAVDAAANEDRVHDLEAEMAKRPAQDRCALSDGDARRLRGIAGPRAAGAPAPR